MKTTLVKEKIDEIQDRQSEQVASGDLTYAEAKAVATQALETLVNDECIKARIDEIAQLHTKAINNKKRYFDFFGVIEKRIAQLRATESPLKPVKEDI